MSFSTLRIQLAPFGKNVRDALAFARFDQVVDVFLAPPQPLRQDDADVDLPEAMKPTR